MDNAEGKNILVTGGAGFIGSHLCDRLIEQGKDVVIIDDLSSGKEEYINPRAKFYKIDICSPEIEKIFIDEKFDYVFHLAAQIDVRKSAADPAFDNKINALGSLNIIENCRKFEVKKIIFVSTGGALYGEVLGIADENHPILPLSPYGIHKYTVEKYLHFYKKVYGLDYAVLRLANVYGPRQYKGGECGVTGIFASNFFNKIKSQVFGDGLQVRDYVYVDDVVRAIILAKELGECEAFNIGTAKETSVLDIIKEIEKATGEKFIYEHKEVRAGEVLRSVLSFEKAKRILGWEPQVDFSQGIKNTIEWIKNN